MVDAAAYHPGVAATYGVFCADCNEVFGTYESKEDAERVAELHGEVNDHDCSAVDALQTSGDPGSLSRDED
jgi:hypothetical protein